MLEDILTMKEADENAERKRNETEMEGKKKGFHLIYSPDDLLTYLSNLMHLDQCQSNPPGSLRFVSVSR
jgi:hypothetical protein